MRDGLGRTGFTLLGIDKASVGKVHPETVITLGKSKGAYLAYNCLQTFWKIHSWRRRSRRN